MYETKITRKGQVREGGLYALLGYRWRDRRFPENAQPVEVVSLKSPPIGSTPTVVVRVVDGPEIDAIMNRLGISAKDRESYRAKIADGVDRTVLITDLFDEWESYRTVRDALLDARDRAGTDEQETYDRIERWFGEPAAARASVDMDSNGNMFDVRLPWGVAKALMDSYAAHHDADGDGGALADLIS